MEFACPVPQEPTARQRAVHHAPPVELGCLVQLGHQCVLAVQQVPSIPVNLHQIASYVLQERPIPALVLFHQRPVVHVQWVPTVTAALQIVFLVPVVPTILQQDPTRFPRVWLVLVASITQLLALAHRVRLAFRVHLAVVVQHLALFAPQDFMAALPVHHNAVLAHQARSHRLQEPQCAP